MEETKQPTQQGDNDLSTPQVPGKIYTEGSKQEGSNDAPDTTPVQGVTDKVQDHDYRNGKPEVTKEHAEANAQNPEIQNDRELRENKGSKPGEEVLEASEEVKTGQSGG